MNIKLSISVLVSDRGEFQERCLDSLSELRRKVPSELIVVFTGKDPKVRKIIEKYTDRIIAFEWCNDFSAARNCGLREARGEWFLFLDDDEWFEDTEEIVQFFLSGEYKRYQTAMYAVRNYRNWQGIGYMEFHAYRMSRISEKLHFQNPIHEELLPAGMPCKRLDSYVHHYGYVNSDGKGKTKKTERNIPSILRDMEKNPQYLKNYMQIVNEYCILEEWDDAEKYCEKGRMLCTIQKNSFCQDWFRAYYAMILKGKGDLKTAVQEIDAMLTEEMPREIVRLKLYSILISICVETKRYEETITYGKKFEELLQYMDRNKKLWREQEYPGISEREIKDSGHLYAGRCNCVVAALSLEKEEEVKYFLELLPWNEERIMEEYYPYLDVWKEKFGKMLEDILQKLSYPSPYLLLQNLIMNIELDNKEVVRIFQGASEEIENNYLRKQLIQMGIKNNFDLSTVAKKMDLLSWQSCVTSAVEEMELLDIKSARRNFREIKGIPAAYFLWLQKEVLEKELFQEGLIEERLQKRLYKYCECVLEFYQQFYKNEIFEKENKMLLPKEARFAILMMESLELSKEREYVACIRMFREMLQICPEFTGIINELVREMKKKAEVNWENQEELCALGEKMKEAIRTMLFQGQYQQAAPVIEQLLTILPGDIEILKMRDKILKSI